MAVLHQFHTTSETDPKKIYLLIIHDDGTLECSCPAYQFACGPRMVPQCKHIKKLSLVLFKLAKERLQD